VSQQMMVFVSHAHEDETFCRACPGYFADMVRQSGRSVCCRTVASSVS
jgi:hypothetical protein